MRLDLGAEGAYERDPEITILSSYEGLEAGNVYIYSGKYHVIASDDGINSAGGSSNGSDPGSGGSTFRPGGGPGSGQASGDYNIYVSGGDIYVDCNGDGLDSNGGLYLTGGTITVLSMRANGDNSPIDAESKSVSGADITFTGSWTFTPENSDHDCPSKAFIDLDTGAWYHEAVDYVLNNSYFRGTGKNIFEPDGDMTRAMFVTVLSRIEGIDSDNYTGSAFDDVETGTWYSPAVKWASEKGIVLGINDNEFNPEGKVTREQMAAIMYRYAGYKGIDISNVNTTKYNSFSDTDEVSGWAADALAWAADRGIINGMGDGTISPGRPSSRAQVAQIIRNYCGRFAS